MGGTAVCISARHEKHAWALFHSGVPGALRKGGAVVEFAVERGPRMIPLEGAAQSWALPRPTDGVVAMNRVTRSIEELAADGFGALAAAGDDGVVLVRKRGGVVLPLGAIVRGLERALQGGMGPEDAADFGRGRHRCIV